MVLSQFEHLCVNNPNSTMIRQQEPSPTSNNASNNNQQVVVPPMPPTPVRKKSSVVGSPQNNSHKPFASRYNLQKQSLMDNCDNIIINNNNNNNNNIESFVQNCLHSQRAVVFLKNNTDKCCNYIHELFKSLCPPDEIAFYHLDEIPCDVGNAIFRYLHSKTGDNNNNCFVFVRGTHVPFSVLQMVLQQQAKSNCEMTSSAASGVVTTTQTDLSNE